MRHTNPRPAKVEDLMTYEPLTLKPSDTVDRARDLMLSLGIHGIPIEDNGRLVGIVTSHDLVDDWPPDQPLGDVMTGPVVVVDVEAGIAEAAALMKSRLVHHLVVNDGITPIGVITTYDMLDALIPTDRH